MGTFRVGIKIEIKVGIENYPICTHMVNFINLFHYTKPDLQKHMLSHIWYMALTFRQVNCPLLETGNWPWPLDIQIWKFKGVCHTQIISNCTDSLQTHGNVMEISINPYCSRRWQGNTIPIFWSTFLGPNVIK